jgi:hypothetical protein
MAASKRELYADHNAQLEIPMKSRRLPFAMMAAGLLLSVPAFAQTTATPQNPPKKQSTQEGAPTIPQTASDYKQKTQEGAPAIPTTANDYKNK